MRRLLSTVAWPAAVLLAATLNTGGCDARVTSKHHRAGHHHQPHQHQPSAHQQHAADFPVHVDLPSVLSSLSHPSVRADADEIISALVSGPLSGLTWTRLANFTDTIGPRVCGSATLEGAVQFMVDRLTEDGLDNVHTEVTSLPYWSRGQESATLQQPRVQNLNMLGLGGSVGTQQYGEEGLTAEVLVVASFDDLKAKADQAAGKIVLFNQYCDWVAQPVDCYGVSVAYRLDAHSAVAAVGGLAALVKTVGSFSINSPHTGPPATSAPDAAGASGPVDQVAAG